MADERLLTYRSSSQNRQAESSRQSQRNIAARAQLSENEREDQRERQRRRSRATAREQYLTLRTDQLSCVRAVQERGFHLR